MSQAIPRSIQRAIEQLSRLPSVGPKTASRLAFYLLNRPAGEIQELGQSIVQLREGLTNCEICHTITEKSPCPICSDDRRDPNIIAVVEEPLDIVAMEKAQFGGKYHVLGGAISPIHGIGPNELHLSSLLQRVKDDDKIKEIILATNPTLEGEATAMYIYREVGKLSLDRKLKTTRIARGLPIGGDLEYADEMTVTRALEGRKEY
jgi:recombination protein RecR